MPANRSNSAIFANFAHPFPSDESDGLIGFLGSSKQVIFHALDTDSKLTLKRRIEMAHQNWSKRFHRPSR